MTRTYFTLGRLAATADTLSDRDLAIVATLAKARLATTRQLERLHFSDGSPLSNARRCRRSLERLTQLGMLARLERRIGGVRRGSASYVYALDVGGQRLNGGRGPAGRGRVQRPWLPADAFLAHALARTECYVQLVEADRAGHVELVRFDSEPVCWRRFIGPGGASAVVKPDAYVVTAADDDEFHRFLEVDRSTESVKTIERKLVAYRQLWMSGVEQERHGVFPQILITVPDERRRAVIAQACRRQPKEAQGLFDVRVWTDALRVLSGGEP